MLINQTIPSTRKINLNKFQMPMNWKIFNIKYLVLMFVYYSSKESRVYVFGKEGIKK